MNHHFEEKEGCIGNKENKLVSILVYNGSMQALHSA